MDKVKCVVCDCNAHNDYSVYCYNCGSDLLNFCTNDECEYNDGDSTIRPEFHKFCDACGSKTVFGNLLELKELKAEEDKFRNI